MFLANHSTIGSLPEASPYIPVPRTACISSCNLVIPISSSGNCSSLPSLVAMQITLLI